MSNHYGNSYKNLVKVTPQSEPICGREEEMVKNNAGGYTFKISPMQYLDRFILLGSEGSTYYVSEKKLTIDNMKNVIECIKKEGKKVVDRVVEISNAGRAPKNTPALFVLALCMSPDYANIETRRYAVEMLPKVARTGTHILQLAAMLKEVRGWGKLTKKAISNWFESKTPEQLALQVVKYFNREGWTLRDLLRMCHAKSNDPEIKAIYSYIVNKEQNMNFENDIMFIKVDRDKDNYIQMNNLIYASEKANKATKDKEIIKLINDYNLPREAIPTEFLNSVGVWRTLLENGMPITAMIRNLGKMSSIGLLSDLSYEAHLVAETIKNPEILRKGRVHPISLFMALKTYSLGRGLKGSLVWKVNSEIKDALEKAFYLSFKNVESTGKRFYLGVDVSGSMGSNFSNYPFSVCEAASAMSMLTFKTEERSVAYGFCDKMVDLKFNKNDSLQEIARKAYKSNFGCTDCAQPIIHALRERIPVDCFIIYTDNETYYGNIHPNQALIRYRKEMGINAKLIVCGMTATNFTIADPKDLGMLDIVGFDSNIPQIINEFVK